MIRTATIFLSALLALSGPSLSQELAPLWPDAAEIEHFLKKAKITERKKIGEGITKPEKVTLELNGQVRYAIYKKVDQRHDNWRFEVAAYELDKLLGLGMVPPTVKRGLRGRKGCLQLWVDGKTMDKYEEEPPDSESWRRQVSLMWLFDDLIANIDRHLNNALISPEHRLILIDNSKTFRQYRKLLNDLNGAGTGTHARFWFVPYEEERTRFPTTYPVEFIERLRGVTDKQIKKALGGYVWGFNSSLVVKRRQMILGRLADMGAAVLVQN